MIDNTNVSNVCLNDCKEKVCACIRESNLSINCDEIKDALTQEIDIRKFKTWFDANTNNFKNKTNPNSYFKKAFLAELSKGKFEVEELSIDPSSLMRALRFKGIKTTPDDSGYAEIMWEEIIKAGMPTETVVELNHKIVRFLMKDQTFEDYVSLVKRSNAIKAYTVDWERIQQRYLSLLNEWNQDIERKQEDYEEDE